MASKHTFPTPVSDLASAIIDPVLRKRTGVSVGLVQSWDEIVGPRLAAHSRPEKIVWPRRPHEDDPFEPATLVIACEGFAAKGAFGEESELAAKYRASGHGSYLGNASKGRVDGNLFLVFWLGNMVGCKDTDGVFFKDKLDQLPVAIHEESRRRNVAYIKWLAANLIGQ